MKQNSQDLRARLVCSACGSRPGGRTRHPRQRAGEVPRRLRGRGPHRDDGPGGKQPEPEPGPSPCWGLGPNFSETNRSADVPVFYTLFVPGATQLMCPDGTRVHDMVPTAVPGDRNYNGAVRLVRCTPGMNFEVADMPHTSAAEVDAGIAARELSCRPGPVLAAPVVG